MEQVAIVDSCPPRSFSFRWTHSAVPSSGTDSLLVEFALAPEGSGTRLHLTETGFRSGGRAEEAIEALYVDHIRGWDLFLPRIVPTAQMLVERP